jgi:hypothetical protein
MVNFKNSNPAVARSVSLESTYLFEHFMLAARGDKRVLQDSF